MVFLARTAEKLVDLPPESDIYAFPDPGDQHAFKQMLTSECEAKPEYQKEVFKLTCKDNTKKRSQ